jgi:hypothetical protein
MDSRFRSSRHTGGDHVLFDELERTDATPKKEVEDDFSFLNRVAGHFWSTIRDELDRWFVGYPASDALDLRNRFRSPRPDQHWAAWWELYLYRTFEALGFAVEVHPEIAGTDRRPDFRLRRKDTLYVEATTVFSGIVDENRNPDREAWIVDTLNEIKSTDFVVWLHFEQLGTAQPSKREIIGPVQNWLAGLNVNQAESLKLAGGPLPEHTFLMRDWRVRLQAVPRRRERRTKPADRFVGIGPIEIGFVDDRDRIGKALERKKTHHSNVNGPLVLAVLGMSRVLDHEDVAQALFGSEAVEIATGRLVRKPDGFWRGPRGPSGTRISAVLLGSGTAPWFVAQDWPTLWLNPWATEPLEMELPFPLAVVQDEQLTFTDASRPPHEVLDLPPDWPGDPNTRFALDDSDDD